MDSTNLLKPLNNNNNVERGFLVAEQLVYASLLTPMVVRAAIKLDVFEIINNASTAHLSPSQIASQIPNNKNPDAHIILDRMLRYLASQSLLTCATSVQENGGGQVERLYGLTPVSKYFVNNEDGPSLTSSFLLNNDKIAFDNWYYLDDIVLDPNFSTMMKVFGMDYHEYVAQNPKYNELFNRSMSDETTIVMKEVLEKYKGFDSQMKVVVDVGGGVGTNVNMIVSKYPKIKGINFDLPHVIETAPSYPGVEHVRGDMFVSVPKGDAIFMRWVLHNWSDEECLKLLKNCYEALPEGGKVIVVEMIVPVVPEPNDAARFTYAFDLLMMTISSKVKERTEKDFEALAKGSGFAGFRLACNACNFWVIEFLK